MARRLGTNEGALFPTQDGESFSPDGLTELVGRFVREAGINKKGSCHIFRHTMATLMLERGADIRFVQAMLGHANLDTTAIYTQVSIMKLQEGHALTHPGAKLGSATQPVVSVHDDEEEPATAEDLLSRLAAEDEVLGDQGDARCTLVELVGRVVDGVTRPGAWECSWLEQASGAAWQRRLEPDPAAYWRQRPQRVEIDDDDEGES